MEKKHQIKETTLNNILNYLSTQPYKDVAGLIQAVSNDLTAQAPKTDSVVRKVEEKAKEA